MWQATIALAERYLVFQFINPQLAYSSINAMKAVYQCNKFLLLVMLCFELGSIFDGNVVQANEPINIDLLLGEWKVVSFYDPDSELTIQRANSLNNKIIFNPKKVTEISQISSASKPYKAEHKYNIKADCVLLSRPDENVCWQVKELSKNKLILETPTGVYNLIK